MLKLLTFGKSTLNTKLLVRIYKATIRSKLDYGATVLSSIPKSKMNKLETTQNTILRNIIGALKSTPTPLIYLETGLTSIKDRWDLLASRYLNKLNTKPWNPAYSTIQNTLINIKTWKPRSIPAVIPHLNKMRINSEECFSLMPSYNPWIEPIAPWNLFEIKQSYSHYLKKQRKINPNLPKKYLES